MMSDIGELGTLADGSGSEELLLAEGLTVPMTRGSQPLARKPLPPLPMPRHPFLLDETASVGVHGDSYNSGVSPFPGPLGVRPRAVYVPAIPGSDLAMCTPMLQVPGSRLASVCVRLGAPSQLLLFDPERDFRILARAGISDEVSFLRPGLGWYARLDQRGRPILANPQQEIRRYELVEDGGQTRWRVDGSWDLRGRLPEDEQVMDVVPDWKGNYWFVTGRGYLGYVDHGRGAVDVIRLSDGEEAFGTALAVTSEAAFMLGTRKLYRLEADGEGRISIRWSWAYGEAASTNGDLTAPTVFDRGRLIAFGLNDGRARARVVVMRTTGDELTIDRRLVCQHPVFKPGRSFLDNSMVGYDRSLVVQNNHGGVFFELVEYEPGLARVDVRGDFSGCDTVWEDYRVSSQVPPRLSTGDGHVYQYSRKTGTGDDVHVWYLSAHDFETGQVSSELFIGSGERLDNPMLSVDFMPGGVMVAGVRNGIVTLKDTQ
jgi:hypothetical protein